MQLSSISSHILTKLTFSWKVGQKLSLGPLVVSSSLKYLSKKTSILYCNLLNIQSILMVAILIYSVRCSIVSYVFSCSLNKILLYIIIIIYQLFLISIIQCMIYLLFFNAFYYYLLYFISMKVLTPSFHIFCMVYCTLYFICHIPLISLFSHAPLSLLIFHFYNLLILVLCSPIIQLPLVQS